MGNGTEGKRCSRRRRRSRSEAASEQRGSAYAEPDGAQQFDEVYRAWKPLVLASARTLLDSDDDAEDAAQVVFCRLWASGGWRRIDSPHGYFVQAARRAARDFARRHGREFPLDDRLAGLVPDGGSSVEAHLTIEDRKKLLHRVFGLLPAQCANVMRLIFVDELSRGAAAETLGIKLKAVEKQITHGYGALRARRKLPL